MVRLYPLVGLALVLTLISTTFGVMALWAICILSVMALVALLVAFYRRGTFIGPRILMEDARDRLDTFKERPTERGVIDVSDSRSDHDA